MVSENEIDKLKQLILDTDLEKLEQIDLRLREIAHDLYVRERLEKHVDPIVDSKIETFQREIPETMGPAITAALRKQIKDSQQEIIDLLYPLIGKMISKYIRVEIQRLSEKMDQQFKSTFSWEVWVRRIKAWFSGSNQGDVSLVELVQPEIVEVFMVSKGSGILLGNFSKSETVEKEMVAGMLTAIKSFAEDAFKKGSDQLELIEYESFKIRIFNMGSFYLAITISGVLNEEFNSKLQDRVNAFVEKKLTKKKIDLQGDYDFSEDLKKAFGGTKI